MQACLDVILSVDWEGLSLEEKNLQRIQSFKRRWQTPLLHYMNPAYFTHERLKKDFTQIQAQSCFHSDDEIGLHLHGARHFVQASGVSFQCLPSFSVSGDPYEGDWSGQEVMLHTYSRSDFVKMLLFSQKLFRQEGLGVPVSFRAGGWMLGPDQVEVLSEQGFAFDSSAVPPQSLQGSCWQDESLHRYAKIIWQDIHAGSQPFLTSENSSLLEVPNNLGAIDYWKDKDVDSYAQESLRKAQEGHHHLVVITGHQETAVEHFDKLDQFVSRVIEQKNIKVRFLTNRNLMKSYPKILEHSA